MKRYIALALIFALDTFSGCVRVAHAEDFDPVKASLVGVGMLVAPLAVADPQLSVGHSWELEGFSYAATDIFYRFFPKDFKFMAPVLVGSLDLMYRIGELRGTKADDLVCRKLSMDLTGVLARVVIEVKF